MHRDIWGDWGLSPKSFTPSQQADWHVLTAIVEKPEGKQKICECFHKFLLALNLLTVSLVKANDTAKLRVRA